MNVVGEVKYFLGDDYAQLKFSESRNAFSIDLVMVPALHRNKGIGALLVNHVLLLADGLKKDVRVTARPIGSFSKEKLQRLITFYERFGFKEFDRGMTNAYMIRKNTEEQAAANP